MKIKKILSIFLAFIISFGICSVAFAVESDLEINGTKHTYYGDLREGKNSVWEYDWRVDESDYIKDRYVYYSFTIPESGYFYLHYGTPHTSMYAEVYGESDYNESFFSYYGTKKLYHLEKGDYKLIVDLYDSAVDVDIYTGYLGESITDISFDYDQLLDCDFYTYKWNEVTFFESYADATFTFSSGKTYNYTDGTLYGTIPAGYSDGINNISIEFLNQSILSTATVYPASHYIADVNVSNIECYYDKNIEYFNYLDSTLPYGETITFTFTDGTTQSAEYNENNPYITLPNGQDYEIDIYIFYDNYYSDFGKGSCELGIYLGSAPIKSYFFSGTKVSLSENIKFLRKEMNYLYEEMVLSIKMAAENREDSEERNYYLENSLFCFADILLNLFAFFLYYVTFSFI